MLKNMAQRARETIKTTPAESEFDFALVMCVRAHNLLRTPPPQENPGSAPATESSKL